MFKALHYRPFRLLWTGQTVSNVGDHLYRIALAWWVLETTKSAAAMGLVLISATAPLLVFLLIGGAVVDRWPRARIMLLGDLLLGALVLGQAVLMQSGQLTVWQVTAAAAVFGFVTAFVRPAYTALVPEITPAAALPSANSLTGLSSELAGILGPALAGLIVAAGGPAWAFALDGLSFFVSAACLLQLPAGPPAATTTAPPRLIYQIWEGIQTVWRLPWIGITILLAALANITLWGPFRTALPLLIQGQFHADSTILGLFYSAVSLGSVGAFLGLGRAGRLRWRGWLSYGAWLGCGLLLLLLGFPLPLGGLLGVGLGLGLGLAVIEFIWTNTLQELVPGERLGRVASIDQWGSMALLPVGFALAGWASDQFGAPSVFIAGGSLTALLVVTGLIHPAIRALD